MTMILASLLLLCLLASPSIGFAIPKLGIFNNNRFPNTSKNGNNNLNRNSFLVSKIHRQQNRFELFMMRRGISKNNRRFDDNSLFQQLTRKTVTNGIIFTNIIIFIFQKIYPSLTNSLMKINPLVARGQTYRLLSACFAHGSIMHLGFNMYSLYNIGPLAEAKFGTYLYSNTC